MPRTTHTKQQAIAKLEALAVPDNRAGMARFGIDTDKAIGVSMPNIRSVGTSIIKDHDLAQALWDSQIHEARILASLVDHPKWVTSQQMDAWAADFNSWDLCDQVCGNLFDRTHLVDEKIRDWATRPEEFIKRAAFATIAWRAVHDKKSDDAVFLAYLPMIEAASDDPRNFVKKAVNWALRQIGKRSASLHKPALKLASQLCESSEPSAQWIGKDAFKELSSEKMLLRLGISFA